MIGNSKKSRTPWRDEAGQSIIEFAVLMPFLVLLFIGSFGVGVMLDRYLTIEQVIRHGGAMFARGVAFQFDANKQHLIDAAAGLDLQLTSGRTAVYLTLLTRIPPDALCEGNSICANADQVVIVERQTIGDTTMLSNLGMPTLLDIDGQHSDYYDNSDAVATIPSQIASSDLLVPNERLYAIEVFHRPVSVSFPGFIAPDQLYSVAYF